MDGERDKGEGGGREGGSGIDISREKGKYKKKLTEGVHYKQRKR